MARQRIVLGRDLLQNVFRLGEAYGEHLGMAPTTVSFTATGSGDSFQKWKEKGGVTVWRLDRTLLWFSENWPRDLDWPRDIPRPRRTDEVAA